MNLPNNNIPAAAPLIDETKILTNISKEWFYDPVKSRFNLNLIGIDFGDGECCAYIGCCTADRKMVQRRLNLLSNSSLPRPNVLRIAKNEAGKLLCVWHDPEKTPPPSIHIYSNFKYRPGSAQFSTIDPANNLSPELLLQIAFRLLVNDLLRYNLNYNNGNEISPDVSSLLLVGRPSSKEWKNSEQAYTDLLQKALTPDFPEKNNLQFYGTDYLDGEQYKQSIKVQVVSEVTAAFSKYAGASNIGQETYIYPNSFGIIVDNGSSTIDIMFIGGHKVIGEFSVTFGGRDLDRILENRMIEQIRTHFKNTLRQKYQDISEQELERKTEQSLANVQQLKNDQFLYLARRKKEAFYTESVSFSNEETYAEDITFKISFPSDDNAKEIKTATLSLAGQEIAASTDKHKIIEGLQLSDNPFDKINDISWLTAIERIYTAALEQWEKLASGRAIDFLIMTGGVSNMKPVRDKAEEIFKPRRFLIDNAPSYAVSQGLAGFLTEEIVMASYFRKPSDTNIDRPFDNDVNQFLAENADSLLDCVANAGKELTYEHHFGAAVELWRGDPQKSTIADLLTTFGNILTSPLDYNITSSLADDICLGLKNWIDQKSISLETLMSEKHIAQYTAVVNLMKDYIVTVDSHRLNGYLGNNVPALLFAECLNTLQNSCPKCFGTTAGVFEAVDSAQIAAYTADQGREAIQAAIKLPYQTEEFRQTCLAICKSILKDAILCEVEKRYIRNLS